MEKLVFWTTLMVLALVSQPSLAHDCGFIEGEDLWVIKTSVPSGGLDQSVQAVDLESLIDSTNPTLSKKQKAAIADRRWSGRLSETAPCLPSCGVLLTDLRPGKRPSLRSPPMRRLFFRDVLAAQYN